MSISFHCANCNAPIMAESTQAGQLVACPHCQKATAVPASPTTAYAPPKSSGGSGGSTASVIVIVVLVAGFAVLGCGGVLVALLLPAVQAAREAARRTQCSNNLKQIALAMHNYHAVYKAFPMANTVDEQGNPAHSWRIRLLPFLEQQNAYDQYDFNQPWDSPANQAALSMVDSSIFGCPSSDEAQNGYTNYFLIDDKEGIFSGDKSMRMSGVVDGTSNTLLVVEVHGMSVPWAQPKDLTLDEFLANVQQSRHPGVVNIAMADGSVRSIALGALTPDQWRALMSRAGNDSQQLNGLPY